MDDIDKAQYVYNRWNDPSCLVNPDAPLSEKRLTEEVRYAIAENIFTGRNSTTKPNKEDHESFEEYNQRLQEWNKTKTASDVRQVNPQIKYAPLLAIFFN